MELIHTYVYEIYCCACKNENYGFVTVKNPQVELYEKVLANKLIVRKLKCNCRNLYKIKFSHLYTEEE